MTPRSGTVSVRSMSASFQIFALTAGGCPKWGGKLSRRGKCPGGNMSEGDTSTSDVHSSVFVYIQDSKLQIARQPSSSSPSPRHSGAMKLNRPIITSISGRTLNRSTACRPSQPQSFKNRPAAAGRVYDIPPSDKSPRTVSPPGQFPSPSSTSPAAKIWKLALTRTPGPNLSILYIPALGRWWWWKAGMSYNM